jgi:hypothetical protein
MITQQELMNNFKVSGSYVTLEYEKYKTKTLPAVKLFISNSSDVFGIQFYPTGSNQLLFTKSDGVTINQSYPVILAANTGSNISSIELLVNVDSSGFNARDTNTSLQFDIKFNVVAIVSSSSSFTVQQESQFRPLIGTSQGGGGTSQGGGGIQDMSTFLPEGFELPQQDVQV